ncbi:MAG: hypothetical protein NZ560_03025 [Aquificaceae bacterium]|nr:hypothetical protein [Aquificaceae bacterium]MDW8097044.1 DUF2231 domain-containing protein [Aquificaceae bacterium]
MDVIKLHPPFTHFAVAMPLALVVLDIYYRLKKKDLDSLHLLFSLLTSLSVIGATVSGMIAYEPIEDKLYQIETFKVHKYLGLVMGIYFALLMGVRLSASRGPLWRTLFSLMLLVGALFTFLQGSLGGSVVYDHMVKPWIDR